MTSDPKWSEASIGRFLARQIFNRKAVVIVPNCSWTGSECDVLVVTTDLRVIDVEVKVSRADLRKDPKKDKWFHHWDFAVDGPYRLDGNETRRRRDWPHRVWKHYYCLPASVWADCLLAELPAVSGILLMSTDRDGDMQMRCLRPARPNRDADRLQPSAALDVARLANLRMWDAYHELDGARTKLAASKNANGVCWGAC